MKPSSHLSLARLAIEAVLWWGCVAAMGVIAHSLYLRGGGLSP